MGTNEHIELGQKPASETPAPESTVSEDILVTGMTCSHCVMSVTEELTAIDGVQHVSVQLHPDGASRVTIGSAAPIDPAAVRAAIDEAGYSLASASV